MNRHLLIKRHLLTRTKVSIFAFAIILGSCCRCHTPQTYDNIDKARNEINGLIDSAQSTDFASSSKRIEMVKESINKYKSFEAARSKKCNLVEIWNQLLNDKRSGALDRGALDIFLKTWESQGTTSRSFNDISKDSVGIILDQVREAEQMIESEKKTC